MIGTALIFLAILALIPAALAAAHGRSFGTWWVYALFLWPIALVHSLSLGADFRTMDFRRMTGPRWILLAAAIAIIALAVVAPRL